MLIVRWWLPHPQENSQAGKPGQLRPIKTSMHLITGALSGVCTLKRKSAILDYKLAKLLSYNCRYLDDICTINLKYFGDIAKDIYDNTLILEGSACSYKQDTFLDLYIRVVDEKFVTGIYHKVDDFNFEVISFPFPQSNINTMLGYTTFYSQLIRFSRLCNNINDFLFRAKLCYIKLVKQTLTILSKHVLW